MNLGQGKSTFNVENLVAGPPITQQHLNEEACVMSRRFGVKGFGSTHPVLGGQLEKGNLLGQLWSRIASP